MYNTETSQLNQADSTDLSLLPENALTNPVELFTRARLDEVIEQIRAAVNIVPDISTDESRKAIASTAYKVARSKTAIDAAGKGLVEGWKLQAKVIDGLRKHAWDTLETLQAHVRSPLTEWENEQKRIEAEAVEAARVRREAEEAEKAADLARREALVREAEERIAERERAEQLRIVAEHATAAQAVREEVIRVEAAAKAERDAAAAIEQARQSAIDAEARREREAVEAQQAAHDAAQRAAEAQSEAVRQAEARAVQHAAQVEQARKDAQAREIAEREAREANKRHCSAINSKAAAALVATGMNDVAANLAITAIASGKVPAVSITY